MIEKVLVSYGTRHGGTAGIAEKIGQVLREEGVPADVLPAAGIRDLTPYKAVVLGSAVYIGMWHKDAVKFLKLNEKSLSERPVWLFSSGPTGQGDVTELMGGWRFPKAQQPIADRIGPRDITIFHGVVDMKKLNPIERWMLKNVQSPIGDFRDWEAISSWAKAIAQVLKIDPWANPQNSNLHVEKYRNE